MIPVSHSQYGELNLRTMHLAEFYCTLNTARLIESTAINSVLENIMTHNQLDMWLNISDDLDGPWDSLIEFGRYRLYLPFLDRNHGVAPSIRVPEFQAGRKLSLALLYDTIFKCRCERCAKIHEELEAYAIYVRERMMTAKMNLSDDI